MENNMYFANTHRNELVLNYKGKRAVMNGVVEHDHTQHRYQYVVVIIQFLVNLLLIIVFHLPSSHKITVANTKKRAREVSIPQIYSQEIVKVRVNNPDMEIRYFLSIITKSRLYVIL